MNIYQVLFVAILSPVFLAVVLMLKDDIEYWCTRREWAKSERVFTGWDFARYLKMNTKDACGRKIPVWAICEEQEIGSGVVREMKNRLSGQIIWVFFPHKREEVKAPVVVDIRK